MCHLVFCGYEHPSICLATMHALFTQGKLSPRSSSLKKAVWCTKVDKARHLIAGTPIIVSQAGGKGNQQNIQVVRTVLSQQGLKPGQATILISQPALQQAAAASGSVISSAQVIHTAGASPGGTKTSGRGSPKGKAQPVYARIIQPPPGVKLTTVGPSQVQAMGGNVNVLQTVGKLLAGLPTAGVAAPHGATTMTIPTPTSSSSPAPAVVVATTHSVVSGQSLLKSQPSDSGDAGRADAQT